jgi:peptidoglycan/xylan/chitin deacetylase (PgdA/CDA1 family)
VTGTNFINGSVVRWNGADRNTTFGSSTRLTAAITAADIATAGTASVAVFNPTPGGGLGVASFTITAPNPVPTISSLSPSSATAGGASFTLIVNGSNFINGSTVRWNGSSRTTTFVSATQLTAAITAADITIAGSASVTVFNPTPGGGTSGALTFPITPPTGLSGSHTMTYFKDNKAGAISLTHDDGYTSQVTTGLSQLKSRGLKGSFFVITDPGYIDSHVPWATWQTVAAAGHEIASHSVTHPELIGLSAADLAYELGTSQAAINQNIPSQACISFAYPNGDSDATVQTAAAQYYVAARATWSAEGGYINYYQAGSDASGGWLAVNFYDIGSAGLNETITTAQLDPYLGDAARRHGWLSLHFHDITSASWYGQMLDYVINKQAFWIDTFGNIARYMKERLNSTIQVVTDTTSEIRLRIVMDTSLPTATYNVPLTLRSTVPSSWPQVRFQQGSNTQTLTPVTEGSDVVVYYNAVPNGGDVVLSSN